MRQFDQVFAINLFPLHVCILDTAWSCPTRSKTLVIHEPIITRVKPLLSQCWSVPFVGRIIHYFCYTCFALYCTVRGTLSCVQSTLLFLLRHFVSSTSSVCLTFENSSYTSWKILEFHNLNSNLELTGIRQFLKNTGIWAYCGGHDKRCSHCRSKPRCRMTWHSAWNIMRTIGLQRMRNLSRQCTVPQTFWIS